MQFSNTYIKLGERFFDPSHPTPVDNPQLFLWNSALADQLQIPQELQKDTDALAQYFSGNQLLEGAEPLSAAYAGHQFGQFNPQLGDGRAHLLGELLDTQGIRWDLQLKGSGTSAFSRGGDGRCAIGPAVREFIMSEAMHALGVPTTRCLAVTLTGETVYRQQPHPGAVVTRVGSSHIRVGSFQFFSARGDKESLTVLRDYTIDRHFPEINDMEGDRNVLLLEKAIERQINLVIHWLRVGFIHGVMNTDNTAISGDTIDFGPCAMLGDYDPRTVYSSIDHQGRYAYGNQANIALWNMTRFAESLLSLCLKEQPENSDAEPEVKEDLLDQIKDLINGFAERFEKAHQQMLAAKLGFVEAKDGDETIMLEILDQLTARKMDYTQTFNHLTKSLNDEASHQYLSEKLADTYNTWRQRVTQQDTDVDTIQSSMRQQNPVVIPRNHHVEAVLQACESSGSPEAALSFLDVLRNPYQETADTPQYQDSGEGFDSDYQTFCGT
ncbi:YdiU family protein [Maricurvus nonylphenolicus]|uniref:protein adenylyltransferase SelO n=1 Tax=Maricurvus nonylphenolicus TaxID=1008307 RepID=UPI0036F2EA9F